MTKLDMAKRYALYQNVGLPRTYRAGNLHAALAGLLSLWDPFEAVQKYEFESS